MHKNAQTLAQHPLISGVTGRIYRIPFIGITFRRFLESRLGKRFYQDRKFWNESLSSWASAYLGGTLSIDIRNSITVLLAKQLAPRATSLLDLGCAGASLALCLGPEFETYWGVDISDVAIAKAKENLSGGKQNSVTKYSLDVAPVQDFRPSRQFDIIVFNEVLHYLSLSQITTTIHHHSRFLSEGGLILISLKEAELSHLIQSVIMQELKFEYGVLYQQQPERPRWKTVGNRETPAYLLQAFRRR